MEYMTMALSEEALNLIAPPRICELFRDEDMETLTIGGMEDGKLLCCALFSHPLRGGVNDIFLEYLYTAPEKREQGLCTALMAYCREYFIKKEIKCVIAKYYVRPEYAEDYNEFMEEKGFIPLNLTTRLLYYPVEDLERPGSMQMIVDNIQKLPPIMDIESTGALRVREFLKAKGHSQGTEVEEEAIYSRFFLNGRQISGAIIASPVGKQSLYISGVYLDDVAERKNMFLTLFSACVETARKDLGENMEVYFEVGDEDTYQGLLRVFIPPKREYLIMEHLLPLMMEEG